jgi:hypothetical protein
VVVATHISLLSAQDGTPKASVAQDRLLILKIWRLQLSGNETSNVQAIFKCLTAGYFQMS